MQETAPASLPAISPWQALAAALEVPDMSPRQLAAEAEARVARGHLPGRPNHNYSSALEAAVDHRLWLFEFDLASAKSTHAAALDDVDGAFGDRTAADVAKAALDELRRREWVITTYAPIAQRIALVWQLREALEELEKLEPDVERPHYVDVPVASTGVRAFLTPNDEPRAEDVLRKFELRQTLKSRALDNRVTPYSTASAAVESVRSRLARWTNEHPKLAVAMEVRA